MSYTVIRISTRPHVGVPFFDYLSLGEETLSYIRTKYVLSEKRISRILELQNEGLEQVQTAFWKDEDSHKEYLNDPMIRELVLDPIAKYNSENGIIDEFKYY